jgi:hypothetical protein
MRVAFDIDGCLFDVLTPTLNEFNLRYGTNFKSSDITDYHAHKILGTSVSRFIELLDFIWINDFNSIRPYEQDINLHFKKLHGLFWYQHPVGSSKDPRSACRPHHRTYRYQSYRLRTKRYFTCNR